MITIIIILLFLAGADAVNANPSLHVLGVHNYNCFCLISVLKEKS